MSWSADTQSRMKSKLPACFAISSGVLRHDDLVGARAAGASSVLPGEVVNSTTCAPNACGELHPHVPEPAEADDADLLALADLPVPQRRVGRDARAQQRGRAGQVEVRRDAQRRTPRRPRCGRSTRRT